MALVSHQHTECHRNGASVLQTRGDHQGILWPHRLTIRARIPIVNYMVINHGGTLNQTFSAVSHPARRAILARLARGEATVTELAAPFKGKKSLPAISRHLRILEQAGLLSRRKVGRIHHCRLVAAPLGAASAWLATYQRFWDAQLDALDEYLSQPATEPADDPTQL
jgi:DNA-binding transcriptional ArsR family regulator